MAFQFPNGFLWGAATAAHQVEGNNNHSDFWLMENIEGSTFKEPSGSAVDHYRLFREDIRLLAELGLNSYRFSIEWARVEPEEGQFDEIAINHYRDVLEACKEYNVTPIVTLHHFSSPQWLIRAGGWESEETPARFARYCVYVMSELGGAIPYVCTINEANISIGIKKVIEQMQSGASVQVGINTEMMARMDNYYMELGKAFEVSPREIHTFLAPRTDEGLKVIFRAHVEARAAIREVCPEVQVGLSMSLFDIQSISGGEEHAANDLHEEFLQFIPYIQDDDFFGLQNYTRTVFGPDGALPVHENAEKTQMGYEYYPEGLEAVIRYAAEALNKPIIVTENGVSTDDDERRVAFIERALIGVHACIADGIPVLGYTHWSLLDNFEWQLGFSKRFGLIEVDRSTQKRLPKKSAFYYGSIAKSNMM
ncbi:glycoside hydrolase family 1 protein [Paenibacillus sinopodophylli]|uniref:glycoside hydrolase family 1 protein n=1 Tax=Paenibacillus sinopodophylli TaxID=1837342 RepID=UPI00110CE7D6|nr:family 1 glycosylhydrolase [Paenibacillus sinopodophylli]